MTRETTMKQLTVGTLGALVAAYALGPMATQILTPAVPFVHRDFGISMAAAQTLISLAFATIAVMTLVYGPLSDRYGRRPVILGGTALFCLGSLIAALAPTPEAMIAGRVLQAAGSSAGLVLTRTVVHDVYGRERSAKVLAYVTIVMIFVPTLSPLAGGVLLDHTSWRTIFALCGAMGAVALVLLAARLPETHSGRSARLGLREAFGGFRALLADPRYLGPALFFSFVMATFFVTQAAIPYLIVEVRAGTATEYGAWFVVLGAFYIGGNYASARWGHLVPRRKLIVFSGAGCLATAIAGLLAVSAWGWDTATLFAPAIALSLFGAIAIAPVQAEAVAAQPGRSGAASGLMSGMQMALGAAAVQVVGFTHDGTPYPMFIALIACAAGALITYCGATLAGRRARPGPHVRAAAMRRPMYVRGADSLRY
jgi:DHA1 family bicyclomycin/chloramphenicol resistance-like MFS transporter